MKKYLPVLLITLLITVIISILFFTRSQEALLRNLPFFKDAYKNTSLSITTRKGIADIEINGKEYGESPLVVEDLLEGRYEVVLTKTAPEEALGFYRPEHIFIDLYRNTEAFIDLEIAPDGYKSGYVLYYTPAPQAGDQTGFITVESSAPGGRILLDRELYGDLPVSVNELQEGEYKIKIEAKGYESVEVPIIIRQGYNLNVNTYLLPIPTNLEKPKPEDG